ncbi:MAG: hypothetical protein HY301_03050 [Verrucomicrobia bacterium]|nr:hypothetical protein [Verrucomicrobiota bacterium]
MKLRKFTPYVLIVLAAGVAGVLLGKFWIQPQKTPVIVTPHPEVNIGRAGREVTPLAASTEEPPAPPRSSRFQPPPDPAPAPPPASEKNVAAVTPAPAVPVTPTASTAPKEISYTTAHGMLALVGADDSAEEYWIHAINDPKLSAKERQNLIEDLNEAGLSDPKNPTAADLPLILARIQLLEEVSPHALDASNAAAFDEAYKDLINLAEKVIGN